MQIKTLALAVSLALAGSIVHAQSASPYPSPLPQAASTAMPKSADQWVGRMTDFTQNASAFKDPAAFAAWTKAMSDPSMIAAMGTQMMEPGNMLRSLTTMMQPGTTSNYMQFSDPSIYMKWGTAMMNPMWYTQMATSMADPGKMMRWAMLPMDPKMWNMGMQMMNPNLYMKWMMTPTDPRAMSLMFAPMNPQLYGSMMGGVMNPNMVGGANSTWGTFMFPSQPVVQVQGAAPVASPINVFDPSTWFSMMNMFGGMPTMPTMSMPFAMPGMNAHAAPAAAPAAPAPFAVQAGAPTTLSLGGDALFNTGKSSVSDITAEGRAKLDDLVAKAKAFGAIDTIKVTGHADKMGKAAANKKLSLARANAVASYLKSKGVKAKTFITAGAGDTQPVVNCDMNQPKEALKACLAPNRRVDIEVTGAKK
ncbi:MAG: OmpA family protein [Thiobacillus sp.]|nr:OmpA family protein [Thiobacillus sp.]